MEVNGKRFSVSVFVPESQLAAAPATNAKGAAARPRRAASSGGGSGPVGAGKVTVPMQGTIVKVVVEEGQEVAEGDTVVVLEAMKMENNIAADKAGTVKAVKVSVGDSVGAGDIVVEIE